MKTVIVTGGSGYIGSAICHQLCMSGKYKVVNVDISEPKDEHISDYGPNYLFLKFDFTSIRDNYIKYSIQLFSKGGGILGIIHMAAWKDLPASYQCPDEYYFNNVLSTIQVLRLASELNVERFIFSSTAGVYSDDCRGAIQEFEHVNPSSPYGKSKLMCEKIIEDVTKVSTFKSYCLRYQNPIGGIKGVTIDSSDSMFGNILRSIKTGDDFVIFGGDYDTPDGTCIRDYIDIIDISDIHIYLLELDNPIRDFDVINVGRGEPVSCRKACTITQKLCPEFKWYIGNRREGDAPGSYADITKLRVEYKYDIDRLTPLNVLIQRIINLA